MRTAVASLIVALGVAVLTGAGLLGAPSDTTPLTWQIDAVDTDGPGKYSSMKVDTVGNVHVVYVVDDGNRYPLKYAIWTASAKRWFKMTIAQSVGACALTLDSKQRPHISYTDYGSMSGSKLRYAHWDGQMWRTEALRLNSDTIAYYNSIALDLTDNPTLSFYEYRGALDTDFRIRLRTVMWDGQGWNVRTVDSEQGSGKFNAMVADSKGHLHIAYANVSAGTAGIRYAYWDNTSWHTQILEGMQENNGNAVGYSAAIALDKDDNPHITYVDETTPRVKYAVRKNGRWQIQMVDTVAHVGYPDHNSIAVDDEGHPYISYYDAGRGILKVAHLEGQRWLAETLDGNWSGFTSSIQIAGGMIWVSYADEGQGAFKVAHRPLRAPAGSSPQLQSSEPRK